MFDRLIDLFIASLRLFQFWVVCADYERGVVLRYGRFVKEIGPGLHLVRPFAVDRVLRQNVVRETLNLLPQSLVTADNKQLVISAVLTYAISDIKKFTLEVETAEEVLADCTYGFVSSMVMSHDWDTIRNPEFVNKVEILIRRRAKEWGIHIIQVQWSDLTPSKSLRLWHTEPEPQLY